MSERILVDQQFAAARLGRLVPQLLDKLQVVLQECRRIGQLARNEPLADEQFEADHWVHRTVGRSATGHQRQTEQR